MVSGIEGVGEAVTGGMIARAVEPGHGEAGDHDETCLNCGAALNGPYCHLCGQKGHVHRTLHAFWHDLLHSVLHFEGKIWRTLPLLAWRPGELTRRYIDGERARFVSPLALFLFSVFLMFAVFGTVGGPVSLSSSAQLEQAQADVAREAEQLRTRITDAERRRDELVRRRQPTTEIDSQLTELRTELQAVETTQSFVLVPSAAPEGTTRTADLRGIQVETGWERLDQAVEKARENPSLLFYKLQSNAYKFSWALIPLSVPFLWLLFLHRRRYRAFHVYDHVVFVTYSIAAMTLLIVLLSLLRPLLGSSLAPIALTFFPPFHMYRQLRGTYGLSRFSALWRTFFLVLFAFWASTLFFLLLLTLGLLG